RLTGGGRLEAKPQQRMQMVAGPFKCEDLHGLQRIGEGRVARAQLSWDAGINETDLGAARSQVLDDQPGASEAGGHDHALLFYPDVLVGRNMPKGQVVAPHR